MVYDVTSLPHWVFRRQRSDRTTVIILFHQSTQLTDLRAKPMLLIRLRCAKGDRTRIRKISKSKRSGILVLSGGGVLRQASGTRHTLFRDFAIFSTLHARIDTFSGIVLRNYVICYFGVR